MDEYKLKELIEKSGKKVFNVQKEVGLNNGQLYRILNGKHKRITFDTVVRLARYFGVTTDYFIKE